MKTLTPQKAICVVILGHREYGLILNNLSQYKCPHSSFFFKKKEAGRRVVYYIKKKNPDWIKVASIN